MPEMIRCDCWVCIDRPDDDPSVMVTAEFYWRQRRIRPGAYDNARVRPITRRQLQPGDVFMYNNPDSLPFFVPFDNSRSGHLPRPNPTEADLRESVTVIAPDDVRCASLWRDPFWPHYELAAGVRELAAGVRGAALVAERAAMPSVPTIDPNTAEVW